MMILRSLRLAAVAALACVASSCLDSGTLTAVPSTPGASPVKWVLVQPAAATIAPGTHVALDVSVQDAARKPLSGQPVTWTSSNSAIASVDDSGVVTAHTAGAVHITAASGGASAFADVTVAPSPSVGTLYSGYSAESPHWPHIRTMMTDFYYQWTPDERAWAGGHYDYAMSGDGAAWVAANPTVRHLVYALEWAMEIPSPTTPATLTTSYYGDMQQWYGLHSQYSLESAFLHQAGSPQADSAHRLVIFTWGTNKWLMNPADPGLRAYQVDRLTRAAASDDGIFLDTEGSGGFLGPVSTSLEYPTTDAYQTAHTSLLAAIKQGLGDKMLMINTSQYTTDFDLANAVAAGAVHLEKMNNPLFSEMNLHWQWCEELTNAGVFVDFVSTFSTSEEERMSGSIPPGNSATTVQRLKLWELASYYLAVPASPELFALQLENLWDRPYSTIWTRAQEANIGHPTGVRRILSRGADPLGQGYTVYSRDFDRALVLVRLQAGWGTQSYVDASAITVPLPGGETWLPLHADGTLGAAVTSIKLRNAEAAILIKQSTIQ